MYRLVIAVALASSLSIISSSDAFAKGGGRGGGGGGGGHVGHAFHFGGNFVGRNQGVGNRAASLSGIRGGPGSGFRPLPHSLAGARFLNKHIDHQRRFQNKIIILGGY